MRHVLSTACNFVHSSFIAVAVFASAAANAIPVSYTPRHRSKSRSVAAYGKTVDGREQYIP